MSNENIESSFDKTVCTEIGFVSTPLQQTKLRILTSDTSGPCIGLESIRCVGPGKYLFRVRVPCTSIPDEITRLNVSAPYILVLLDEYFLFPESVLTEGTFYVLRVLCTWHLRNVND